MIDLSRMVKNRLRERRIANVQNDHIEAVVEDQGELVLVHAVQEHL